MIDVWAPVHYARVWTDDGPKDIYLYWVGNTRWGGRVGSVTEGGETLWTSTGNVEVVPVCPLCAEE